VIFISLDNNGRIFLIKNHITLVMSYFDIYEKLIYKVFNLLYFISFSLCFCVFYLVDKVVFFNMDYAFSCFGLLLLSMSYLSIKIESVKLTVFIWYAKTVFNK